MPQSQCSNNVQWLIPKGRAHSARPFVEILGLLVSLTMLVQSSRTPKAEGVPGHAKRSCIPRCSRDESPDWQLLDFGFPIIPKAVRDLLSAPLYDTGQHHAAILRASGQDARRISVSGPPTLGFMGQLSA
jgi:hypothetical protein